MKCSSQRGASDNIDLKETWFTQDPDKYPIKTLSHESSVIPENNNNTLTPLHYVLHLEEIQASKGGPVSEII